MLERMWQLVDRKRALGSVQHPTHPPALGICALPTIHTVGAFVKDAASRSKVLLRISGLNR